MTTAFRKAAIGGFAFLLSAALGACATVDTGIDRIDTAPVLDPAVLKALPDTGFEAGEFRAKNGVRIPYRWLAPNNADEDDRYPLVVVMHSSGQIGDDNAAQLNGFARTWASPEIRTRYPVFVLVPQFPTRSAEYDDPAKPQLARATPALTAALEAVDAFAAEHPVDKRRIYVTGFSMGGSASWLAPLLRPDLFAAAVPMSGIAPDRESASRLAGLPILALHGDADTENPIDSDRAMIAAIRNAGGERARLREYAGLDHRVAGDVFFGTWWRDWMFDQRRPKPEEKPEE